MRKETFGTRVRRLRKEQGLTQAALATRSGLSQTTISNIETGRNASSSEIVALARALGNIAPEFLQDGQPLDQRITPVALKTATKTVPVPLLNAVSSAGMGLEIPDQEITIDLMHIPRDWIDRQVPNVTDVNKLALISAMGSSMSPTINDGDILLVDTGVREVKIDDVYVMRAHGRLFVKRVRQKFSGLLEVSSDNPNAGAPEELNGESEVEIIGRVRWIWNGRRP